MPHKHRARTGTEEAISKIPKSSPYLQFRAILIDYYGVLIEYYDEKYTYNQYQACRNAFGRCIKKFFDEQGIDYSYYGDITSYIDSKVAKSAYSRFIHANASDDITTKEKLHDINTVINTLNDIDPFTFDEVLVSPNRRKAIQKAKAKEEKKKKKNSIKVNGKQMTIDDYLNTLSDENNEEVSTELGPNGEIISFTKTKDKYKVEATQKDTAPFGTGVDDDDDDEYWWKRYGCQTDKKPKQQYGYKNGHYGYYGYDGYYDYGSYAHGGYYGGYGGYQNLPNINKYTKWTSYSTEALKRKDEIMKHWTPTFKQTPTPWLIVTPECQTKMKALVAAAGKYEIAWNAFVKIPDGFTRDDNVFFLYDVVVYPQTVSGATSTTDEDEFGPWFAEMFEREDFENLRFHGHSHVKMSTSPSGTDKAYRDDILASVNENDFYFFAIYNQKDELNIEMYDAKNMICWESSDITYLIANSVDEVKDAMQWAAQSALSMCKTTETTKKEKEAAVTTPAAAPATTAVVPTTPATPTTPSTPATATGWKYNETTKTWEQVPQAPTKDNKEENKCQEQSQKSSEPEQQQSFLQTDPKTV